MTIDNLIYFQLSNFCSMQDEFKIFPVLTLLTHLYPSPLSSGSCLSKYILPVIKLSLSCRSEKLRQLSVGALVSVCETQLCFKSPFIFRRISSKIYLITNKTFYSFLLTEFSECLPKFCRSLTVFSLEGNLINVFRE